MDASYTEVSIERSRMTASSNLPSLRVLNLAACSNVGDAGFSYKYIIAGMNWICLDQCGNLVSLEVKLAISKAFVYRCSCLEELDVTDCNIDDAGLECIAKCRFLKTLKLGFCKVSDNGTDHVGRQLDQARFIQLNLSYCRISNAGLVMLGNLRCLQNVKLVQIGNVSVEVLVAALLSCVYFKKACHGLENSGQYGSSPKSFVESFHVR
ncbi:hypothetical protein SELMODRAFT_408517 [Selaginella moellendorffii]|uniref:Uncharacterized protein n=1 Tax=Selaginella moellendorffii TaxID=88036 RepID=D8R8J8_SELML|nr:hypothetical protein SELMODRAFT_408517 [Selaginella moellendorffii]